MCLFQIPSDQLSTLCGLRGLSCETSWALGGLDASPRRAAPRPRRWRRMAANLWRCSFASRASRKNCAACSRNRPSSEKSWPVRRYNHLTHSDPAPLTGDASYRGSVLVVPVYLLLSEPNSSEGPTARRPVCCSAIILSVVLLAGSVFIESALTSTGRWRIISHVWARDKETSVLSVAPRFLP